MRHAFWRMFVATARIPQPNLNGSRWCQLTFLVGYFFCWGVDVYVAGDTEELGRWKVGLALQMEWAGPPNRWRVEFEVSRATQKRGVFAYKYFVSSPRDRRFIGVHYWESLGPNRVMKLPPATPPAVLVRSDKWGNTQRSRTTSVVEVIGGGSSCSHDRSDDVPEDIVLFYPIATAPRRALQNLLCRFSGASAQAAAT